MKFGNKSNNWELKKGDILVFKFSNSCNKAGEVLQVYRNKVLVLTGDAGHEFKMKVSRPFILGAYQAEINKSEISINEI